MTTTRKRGKPKQAVRSYYVTVQDDGRTGFLLGPYATHGEALAQVDRGRALAEAADAFAAFYAFGTASLPAGETVKTVFGL